MSTHSSIDRRRLLHGTAALGLTALAAPALARTSDASKVIVVGFELIRPSQGAVGMREVTAKTADLLDRARKPDKLEKFLIKEALPVVKGPAGYWHLIDHHHHGRAVWDIKRTQVPIEPIEDLSRLAGAAFWAEMDKRGWLHAFDADGRAVSPDKLPGHVRELGDDVYRSLAGSVRDAGGFSKTETPFAEFKWADFFRPRITRSLVVKDFAGAAKQALLLARSADAAGLPGYAGKK